MPACIVEGFRLLTTGVAPAVMMNVELPETPPLALTVIPGAPCEAISALPTDAVSWLALTNTVGNPAPFHRTVEPAVNPEPFTVKVKPAPPAGACDGFKLEIAGGGAVTVKEAPLDTTPPLPTVIVNTPRELMKLAGIAAVNCVALTKVVETGSPLHMTTDEAVKPDPLTVSAKPCGLANRVDGLRVVIVGVVAAVIVKMELLDAVPFELTDTSAEPGEAI